jgi:hypothetical protein
MPLQLMYSGKFFDCFFQLKKFVPKDFS